MISEVKDKYIIIAIIVVIGMAFVLGMAFESNDANLGGADSLPPIVAASSTAVEVGPDENVQVIASSSRRSYLYIASDELIIDIPVYCRADGDKLAAVNQGIKLSTTTSMVYEFTEDRGNMYGGAVRCTSAASSTLLVHEYSTR